VRISDGRGVTYPMLAHQIASELDDRQVLRPDAVQTVLPDRNDRCLGYVLTPNAADLCALDIFGLEFACDGHHGERADPYFQGSLEADEGAEVGALLASVLYRPHHVTTSG
jgi:hypothetical protein